MVKHVPVFLLHPMLPCFILLLNSLVQLISLNRLQLDGRILIFIKVQFSHGVKMVLNMLRQVLLINIYLLIPVILNCGASCWVHIVVVSLWAFALTSEGVGVLGFDGSVEVFSVHSFESAFLPGFVLGDCWIVKVLNFLFLRYGKHKATFIRWRYFSLRTFKPFIKLLFNRQLRMILSCQIQQILFLSIAIHSPVNILTFKFLRDWLHRLTSRF